EDQAVALGGAGDVTAELLVDEQARGVLRRTIGKRLLEAFEDDRLRVGDAGALLLVGRSGDAEHLLLERPPVIEGQDVKRPVVAERRGVHGVSPFGPGWGARGPGAARILARRARRAPRQGARGRRP